MSSRAARMARGSAVLLLAQSVLFVLQFVYVAVTSRTILVNDFGAYAATSSLVALVTLVTGGGVGQVAMRAERLTLELQATLAGTACVLGVIGGGLLAFTGPVWARLWGVPAEALIIAAVPWATLVPALQLAQGIARREGRFRLIAAVSVGSAMVSLTIGAVVAAVTRDAFALVLSSTLTPLLQLGALQFVGGRLAWPRISGVQLRQQAGFTLGVTGAGVLSYVTGNLPRLLVGRLFGASLLGVWNRAESLTLSPFQMLQKAVVQVVYPELRQLNAAACDKARSRRVSDMLVALSWIAVPLAAMVAAAAPSMVHLILGNRWEQAAALVVPLALLAGFTPLSSVLSSILEVTGRFRASLCSQIGQIVLIVAGSVVAYLHNSAEIIGWSMLAAMLVRIAANTVSASLAQLLDARTLVRGHGLVIGGAIYAGVVAWLAGLTVIPGNATGAASATGAIAATVLLALPSLWWRRLPPVKMLRNYGLLASGA